MQRLWRLKQAEKCHPLRLLGSREKKVLWSLTCRWRNQKNIQSQWRFWKNQSTVWARKGLLFTKSGRTIYATAGTLQKGSWRFLRVAWNSKSFTGIRSCQSGSVCTKREELSLCFSWSPADSDRQQLSRKSGKTFCHRQEKLAIFHLAERSRRQCRSLFNHQHRTGKRHWCQKISDEHLPHRRKTITAEIWIRYPRRRRSFERNFFGG